MWRIVRIKLWPRIRRPAVPFRNSAFDFLCSLRLPLAGQRA
jgi:hypothetical protein